MYYFLNVTDDHISVCDPEQIHNCAIYHALYDAGHSGITITANWIEFDGQRYQCTEDVRNWQSNLIDCEAEEIELVFDSIFHVVALAKHILQR